MDKVDLDGVRTDSANPLRLCRRYVRPEKSR